MKIVGLAEIEVTCPFCEKCWETDLPPDEPVLLTCLVATKGCGSNFVVILETEYYLHTFTLKHEGEARKRVNTEKVTHEQLSLFDLREGP